jgi:predicted nucleic acid-binding protein
VKLVIDASVSLKWFRIWSTEEADTGRAVAILQSLERREAAAIQPPHWKAEVLAVMARKEPERIEGAQKLLFSIPCRDCDGASLHERAAQLSVQLKHHLFDTLYHAAVLEHEATLITADEIYFAKARRLGNIKLLSNSTP